MPDAYVLTFCLIVVGPLLTVAYYLVPPAVKRAVARRRDRQSFRGYPPISEPHSHVKIHAPRAGNRG